MNRIYGKVWSRALQQLVVVSELATCHRAGGGATGGASRSLKRIGAGVFTAMAAFGWMGWSGAAQAQITVNCSTSPFNFYNGDASCMGYQAQATAGGTALGASTVANGNGATAVGLSSQANFTHSTAVGWQAYATALNAIYLGARTVGTGASQESAIAIGTDVVASGTYAIGMGLQANASNSSATAIGAHSVASGLSSVAIGGGLTTGASAGADNSVAIGALASTTAATTTAIGYDVHATAANASAYGVSTTASNTGAIALGNNSAASGVNSVVVGTSTTASNLNAAAMGTLANASAANSTALGVLSQATNTGATALGAGGNTAASAVRASGVGSLAAGGNATAGANAAGDNSIALGGQSTATQANAIAIGLSSNATAGNATALGNASQALASGALALGDTATASATNGVAVGTGAMAQNAYDVAVGSGANAASVSASKPTLAIAIGAGQATNDGAIAIGDGFNGGPKASGRDTVAIGTNASATAAGANAIGGSASASGTNAFAGGVSSNASGSNATAIGNASQALAASTVALGDSNSVAATAGTGAIAGGHNSKVTSGTGAVALGEGQTASGNGAVAIGDPNTATGNGAVALGADNIANGDGAVAVGNTNLAQGVGSVAVGNGSDAMGAGSLALGNEALANNANDVALGSHSATAVAVGTSNTVINGTTYNFAGTNPGSTVSVGTVGGERTITNVAAGRISGSSTDAINGSQLNATNLAVTAVGTSVTNLGNTVTNLGDTLATSIGGGTTYNSSTGALTTNVTYGGNTYSSLQQVFNQISNTVNGGGIKYFHANSTLADSIASGTDSVAIGPVSTASTTNAVSIGNGATAGASAGDVALGAGSTTATAVGTPSTAINGTTYNFAGTNPGSTVSVGTVGGERTITNVAAGRISGSSTDAINGSQLNATNLAVTAVGTSVTNLGNTVTNLGDTLATSIGSGTTYNSSTGAITTNVTYGGNSYSSLQQVFNQISSVVDGGGIKYFHANSTLADSNASGTNSVAIGPVSTASTTNAVSIGNGATAGASAGDVALGAGSVTATAVGTSNTVINGTTYGFAGTNPGSTVSVGTVGGERTITNVAAGRISGGSTDAVNGSQLFATNQAVENLSTTVTAGATHYYSVNDGGTQGGNYTNNGATGLDALAAGVGASAAAANGTSLGQNTATSVAGGVALGSGSVSDRAIAPASGSIIVGTNVIPYNTTDRTLLGAVSVGNTTGYRQITNVADGTQDQDAVTLRQLKGAMGSFSVTPIKYFHANSTASDSLAAGANSVAVGPQTTVNGDNGVGVGNGAIVQQTAPGGTAIGQNATVNLADGVALGTNATSNGIQAMALGAGSQAAFAGSVALGAGSVTEAAVGTQNETINGTTYNFAGGAPGSTVSVGTAGAERTITHVAAGRLSASSTDAVNGSQLFAANQAIGSVGTTVTNLGNTVSNLGTSVTNLGNTVTNLGTSIANSYGGNTTYNPVTGAINTSITYGGNTYSSLQQVFNQIDTAGIKYFHANSNLADSLATGVNSVAIGPVSTASTSNAVSIGNGASAGANAGDVALGAGSTTAAAVATGSGAIAGHTYTYAGATPTSTVSVGAAGDERTITNVAAGRVDANSTDAINGSQLFATNQALDALNGSVTANATHYYSVNDGGTQGGNYANNGATGLDALAAGVGASAAAANGTSLGQNTATSVTGGVALGSGSVSDRAIAPASGSIIVGTNVIPYNTTDHTLLGAVSVGNATDFRQITNVADGTQDQDAVTLRQLKGAMSSFSVTPTKYFHANSSASDSLAAGAESVAIGPKTTVNGDNGIGMGNGAVVQQTAPGGTAIGQDATVNLADGVALGTNATSNGIQALALGAGSEASSAGSVALGAGSITAAPVATPGETLNGTTYTFAGTSPGSAVSIGAVGAERTLTNLAAGRISGTSTDAINGSQLYATNQTLEQLNTALSNLSKTVNNLPSTGGGNGGVGTTINTYQTSGDNNTSASASGNNATAAGAGSTASGNNSTAVGANASASGDNSVAIGASSVATSANSVSVGSVGHERTVTNVAAGVNATDAVNVGQLSDAVANAKDWSKNYTDQRFDTVDQNLNRIGNRANAGVASAMAMASLPQAYQPNQSSAGVALGSFHGEASIAVGVSTISESGRYVFKLNATTNSRGDAGAGVGAGMVW